MIIEIQQTISGKDAQFDFITDDNSSYKGVYSLDICSDMHLCTLYDRNNQVVLRNDFQHDQLIDSIPIINNVVREFQRKYIKPCTILNEHGVTVGSIGFSRSAVYTYQYIIQCGQMVFECHPIYRGSRLHLLVLCNGVQIGEIFKYLTVKDCLDSYTLFLIDQYAPYFRFVCLFVLCFDAYNFSSVLVTKGVHKTWVKAAGERNNLYDDTWVKKNFLNYQKLLPKYKFKDYINSPDISDRNTKIFVKIVLFAVLGIFITIILTAAIALAVALLIH